MKVKSMDTKEKNKEEAILEAAEQEFLDKGFEAAKTTDIASMAGVTHAMLHYYYRTKENLFNKIFDEKINLLKNIIFNLADDPGMPFLEKVKMAMEAHFDFLRDNPGLPRFIVNELIFKKKRLKLMEKGIRNLTNTVIEKVREAIDREVEKGAIEPIEPVTLMIDVASLNVFVFVAMPFLQMFAVERFGSEDAFFEARKRENVEIIMKRLKKVEN
ncbi:MAG: TetR/AcrR family transcriptional regulator [Tannerella sp.]|jgi:AcrR family transcriptional regulator|nr:TetR/AcrR family transcriptional regulator [Tannerella sp.]